MKILWFTWRDLRNPLSGGAEIVNEEIAKRLANDGHEVIFLVSGFISGSPREKRDGYEIVRLGNRFSVYWLAYRYYKKHLRGWADLVIDETNTMPFFCKYFVQEKNILFVHQLCREIWFYQMPFPLSLCGFLLEPLYLYLLNDRKVITVSESSKKDLLKFGFEEKKIGIISEGIRIAPLNDFEFEKVEKYSEPTVLSLGNIREMKRTDHQIRAFEIAKKTNPTLRLIVAGDASGKYGKKVLSMIRRSSYSEDIQYLGKVSEEKKRELLTKSHVIVVTSVKEGWGLIVTEANSQGTPAVVYGVDGLRDSVKHNDSGLVSYPNSSEALAESINHLLGNMPEYERLRRKAFQWSKNFTFDRCYLDFKQRVELK